VLAIYPHRDVGWAAVVSHGHVASCYRYMPPLNLLAIKNVETDPCGVPLEDRKVAGFVKRRKKLGNRIGCGCYRTGTSFPHRTPPSALLPYSIRMIVGGRFRTYIARSG
jgi:hypothetical protein